MQQNLRSRCLTTHALNVANEKATNSVARNNVSDERLLVRLRDVKQVPKERYNSAESMKNAVPHSKLRRTTTTATSRIVDDDDDEHEDEAVEYQEVRVMRLLCDILLSLDVRRQQSSSQKAVGDTIREAMKIVADGKLTTQTSKVNSYLGRRFAVVGECTREYS